MGKLCSMSTYVPRRDGGIRAGWRARGIEHTVRYVVLFTRVKSASMIIRAISCTLVLTLPYRSPQESSRGLHRIALRCLLPSLLLTLSSDEVREEGAGRAGGSSPLGKLKAYFTIPVHFHAQRLARLSGTKRPPACISHKFFPFAISPLPLFVLRRNVQLSLLPMYSSIPTLLERLRDVTAA